MYCNMYMCMTARLLSAIWRLMLAHPCVQSIMSPSAASARHSDIHESTTLMFWNDSKKLMNITAPDPSYHMWIIPSIRYHAVE